MQKNKTLVNRAMKAMLLAGFVTTVYPSSVFADVRANILVQTQQNSIKGTVVDEQGEPMIGVTVKVKGSQAATITDINGGFSVNAPNGATLELSYVGYTTQTIKAKDGLRVQMAPDSQVMDEVVVIGYGTIKKRDLTGSVSSVKSEDIARVPVSNPIEAIQGQVAGLDITRTSGDADAELNIMLRGTRSINGDNTPLFIIDGMQGSYSELNPNDIASIEVLKDASSTAVYGSAGANGVIIITTKSPKKGKHSINFDAYLGWNTIPSYPETRKGEDYVNFRRLAQQNAGTYTSDADLFPTSFQNLIDNGNWVNWFDLGTQAGITQSYNLSTSYANDRMSSYFSLGYYNVEGNLQGDEKTRYSARAKIDFTANKIVKYGLSLCHVLRP